MDSVIGGADDSPSGGGGDFDEGPVGDGAGCDDVSPFGGAAGVVVAENSGVFALARAAEAGNGDIPIFCQNAGIPTETIDWLSGQTSSDSDAVDPANVTVDLPPARRAGVAAKANAEINGVIGAVEGFDELLNVGTPAASHLIRVGRYGYPLGRIPGQDPCRIPLGAEG